MLDPIKDNLSIKLIRRPGVDFRLNFEFWRAERRRRWPTGTVVGVATRSAPASESLDARRRCRLVYMTLSICFGKTRFLHLLRKAASSERLISCKEQPASFRRLYFAVYTRCMSEIKLRYPSYRALRGCSALALKSALLFDTLASYQPHRHSIDFFLIYISTRTNNVNCRCFLLSYCYINFLRQIWPC